MDITYLSSCNNLNHDDVWAGPTVSRKVESEYLTFDESKLPEVGGNILLRSFTQTSNI